jgi:hypothetical protein
MRRCQTTIADFMKVTLIVALVLASLLNPGSILALAVQVSLIVLMYIAIISFVMARLGRVQLYRRNRSMQRRR